MAKGKHKSKRKRDDSTVASADGEEGELVTHDDLLGPQEELSNKRHDAAELIMKKGGVEDGTNSPVNTDIDHNIREIRAILRMNAEIFERCMEFMTHTTVSRSTVFDMGETKIKDDEAKIADDDSSSDSSSNSSSEEDDDMMKQKWKKKILSTDEVKVNDKVGEWHTSFNRIAYEVVTTRSRNDGTQVITCPKRTTKEFNTTPLSKLPEGLDGIIVSNNMTGDKVSLFIDFEAFFERALLLHETVLEQFLPKLKEHLMSIQVCLGEIDSWVIQEPQGNINYLEATFEMKMKIPDNHKCVCQTHDPNELCLRCGKTFYNHKSHTRRCHDGSYFHQSFQCQYYQVLKQCNSVGKFETTFNLTNEKDKTKLGKFLEFIAID